MRICLIMTHFFYEEEVNARLALIFFAARWNLPRHLQYILFFFLSYVQVPVFQGKWHGQLLFATSHPCRSRISSPTPWPDRSEGGLCCPRKNQSDSVDDLVDDLSVEGSVGVIVELSMLDNLSIQVPGPATDEDAVDPDETDDPLPPPFLRFSRLGTCCS